MLSGESNTSRYIRCELGHLLSTTAVSLLLVGFFLPCLTGGGAQAQNIVDPQNIENHLEEAEGVKWFKSNADDKGQKTYILRHISGDSPWDNYNRLGMRSKSVALSVDAGLLGEVINIAGFDLNDGFLEITGGSQPVLNIGDFIQNDGRLDLTSRQGASALSLQGNFSHSGGKAKISARGNDSVGIDLQGGDIHVTGVDSVLQLLAKKGAVALDAHQDMNRYIQDQGHVAIEAFDRGSVGLFNGNVIVNGGLFSVKAASEARGVDIGSGVFDLRGGTLRLEQVSNSSTGYAIYGDEKSSAYFRSGSLVETVVDLSAHEKLAGFGGQVTGAMHFGHINIEQNVGLQFDFISVASLDLTEPEQFVFLESQNVPIEGDFVPISSKGSTLLYDYELVKTADGAAYAMELRPKGWVAPPPVEDHPVVTPPPSQEGEDLPPSADPVDPDLDHPTELVPEEKPLVPPQKEEVAPPEQDELPPSADPVDPDFNHPTELVPEEKPLVPPKEEEVTSPEQDELPPSTDPVDPDLDHPTELVPEEKPLVPPQKEEVTPPEQDELPPSAEPVPWPGDPIEPEPDDPLSPQPDPDPEEVKPEEETPPQSSDDNQQDTDSGDLPAEVEETDDEADISEDVEDVPGESDDASVDPPPSILTPSLSHYLSGGSAGYNALSALERVAREAPGSASDKIYDMLNKGDVEQLQQRANMLHAAQTTRLPQLIASGHARFAAASKEEIQRHISSSPLPQLREGDTFAEAVEREEKNASARSWQAWVRSANGVDRFKTSGAGYAALENSYMGVFAGAARQLDNFAFNVSFAYLNHGIDGEGDGYQADGDSFMIMASLGSDSFPLFDQLPLHVDAGLAYGYSRLEQARRDMMGERSRVSFDAKSFHANGGMTHIWNLGDSFTLKPRLGMEYSYVALDDYRETGGVLPLGVRVDAYHSLRPQIGSSAEWKTSGQGGKISGLTLGAHAAYSYELMDRHIGLDSHYLEAPTIHFSTMGEEIGRGSANLGMYVDYELGGGLVSLSGGYDATLADSYDGHQLYLQANRKF